MKEIDQIQKYLGVALERKYWIMIPLLLCVLGGLYYALTAHGVFRASTLILVTHQKVPEGYVRPIVQMTMEEMLQTIQQQVTSRTNLEKIMAEQRVFGEPERAGLVNEEKVELFRQRIKIDVVRGTAFRIGFDYENPKKAMDVTNQLASNFIAENLKIREDHALGTSQFLQDELEVMRKRLEEKEEMIKQYSQRYLGGMPQDLTSNLSTLQRLQTRLDQLNTNLMAAEERRLTLQQQMAAEKMMREQMAGSSSGDSFARAEPQDIPTLRRELARLETKYTESHPDVRRLRDMLARLESEEAENAVENKKGATGIARTGSTGRFSLTGLLEPQLQQVNSEITGLRGEIERVKAQVEAYEKKVEDTPKREQEMILLTRDYETIKGQYENLAKRKIDADIAVNMERKQKGEQFRLLDPAKLPEKPVSPNVMRTLLLSLMVGLCLGGGIAFVAEVLDTSYKSPEEAEGDLHIPVIGYLGYRYSEKELRQQKLKGILKAGSVATGFVVSAFCVVVAAKGADKTLDFIKSFFAE